MTASLALAAIAALALVYEVSRALSFIAQAEKVRR